MNMVPRSSGTEVRRDLRLVRPTEADGQSIEKAE